jgi:hypothetical protein
MIKNIDLSLDLKEFLIYVESLNIGMEPIHYYYLIDVDYKKRLCSVTENGETKFLIGIDKIQYLREILKPLMNDKNVNQLIYILSIAQFYSYLFYDDYFNGLVDFSYVDKYASDYLQFSVGVLNFNIFDNNIQVYNCGDDYIFESFTIEDTYNFFLNYIQQKIIDNLHADREQISNKNILLLEMLKI